MKKGQRGFISSPPADLWREIGDLWKCPECGKLYPRAGQGHSCVTISLDQHFHNRPRARELFNSLLATVDMVGGPVRLSIAKTRIGLITRITFAAVAPRKDYLRAHILLSRRVDSPLFLRVDDGPPYWVHHFEIRNIADINDDLRVLLRESYELGQGRQTAPR